MGKYDLNQNYDRNVKYSLKDLCLEIINEIDKNFGTSDEALKAFEERFHNKGYTGLMDRVKKHLKYDIEKNGSVNLIYEFEMFQLLKMFYLIENQWDFHPQNGNGRQVGFPLINLMKKPRVANVGYYYSLPSIYNECSEKIVTILSKKCDPNGERKNELELVNQEWESLHKKMKYFVNENITDYPNIYLDWIRSISKFFNNVLYMLEKYKNLKFDLSNPKKPIINVKYDEGPLKTFYNMIYYYIFSCYDVSMLKESTMALEEGDSKLYADYYDHYKKIMIPLDTINALKKALENALRRKEENRKVRTSDENCLNLYFLINLGIEEGDEESCYKAIIYALKNVWFILRLIEVECEEDFEKGIDVTFLASILIEIINVNKTNAKVSNDTLGYSQKELALRTVFTINKNIENYKDCSFNKVSLVLRKIWIQKIMNRYYMNFGLYDNVREFVNIEETMLKIKKAVFEFTNFNDVKLITSEISRSFSQIEQRNLQSYIFAKCLADIEQCLKTV